MMNHHMVAAAGGGRHHVVMGGRRPPHIMWAAGTFRICLRMYFLLLTHIVFSAPGPYYVIFLSLLGPNIQYMVNFPVMDSTTMGAAEGGPRCRGGGRRPPPSWWMEANTHTQ